MRPKYEPDIGQLTCWAMNGQKHINELKKYRDELLIYSRLGHGTGLTDLSNLRMNKTSIFSFGTISNEMKTQLLQLDNILKTIITNSEHFLKILKSKPDIIRSVSLVESEKKKKLANKISIIYGALVVADAVSSINRNISASQRDKNMGKYYRENAQTLKYQRRMMKEHIGKPSRSNK
jgi:hypothetical protein